MIVKIRELHYKMTRHAIVISYWASSDGTIKCVTHQKHHYAVTLDYSTCSFPSLDAPMHQCLPVMNNKPLKLWCSSIKNNGINSPQLVAV